MKYNGCMVVAVLGTGMVGQAHAERMAELGHEVTIGTRSVKKALARMEPGRMTEPFGVWAKKHKTVKVDLLPLLNLTSIDIYTEKLNLSL